MRAIRFSPTATALVRTLIRFGRAEPSLGEANFRFSDVRSDRAREHPPRKAPR
jgi:hypothetical protein